METKKIFENSEYINSILLNDEVADDEELIKLFQEELNTDRETTEKILSYRQEAILNPLSFDIMNKINY